MQVLGTFCQDATVELPCLAPRILELSQLLMVQLQKGANLLRRQEQTCQLLHFL